MGGESMIYEDLKKNGYFNIEDIADYPQCDLVTLKGLRALTDENLSDLEPKDRDRLLKHGDENAVYLWLSDNGVYRICRLTEKNAALLENKLFKTRSNYLEIALKRIPFED